MKDSPLSVAVLGCGHLGTFHARLYKRLPEANLIGVVDSDPERAGRLGRELDVPIASRWEDLPSTPQAVSVATPTVTHEAVASECLEAGLHVLVEKPITDSVAAGRRLVELAARRNLVLAVGHVERFSPAFQKARPSIGQPRFIESHRLAPFVPRSLDVDVVLDLMIHDLDLTLSLIDAEIESLDAVGVPVLTDGADIANARIRFDNGAVANLTASRVSRDKKRKIRFFGRQQYHSLDLMEGKVERVLLEEMAGAAREAAPFGVGAPAEPTPFPLETVLPSPSEPMDAAAALPESLTAEQGLALLQHLASRGLSVQYGDVPVPGGNALEDELRDFLGAIAGAPLAGASGQDGLRSLEVAERIRTEVGESLRRLGIDPTA